MNTNSLKRVGVENLQSPSTKKLRSDEDANSEVEDSLSKRPENSFFNTTELEKFCKYLAAKMNIENFDTFCRNTSGLRKIAETEYFIYYGYNDPTKIFLGFNARAVIVNYEFNRQLTSEIITELDELRPTCKVVALVPSLHSWWHVKSVNLLKEHLSRLQEDIIEVSARENSPLKKFILKNDVPFDTTMKATYERIKSRVMDDGRIGLFSMRIPSTRERKSRISIPLYKIEDDGTVCKDDWNSLFPAININAIGIVKVIGLKITKNTVNFDLELNSLFYKNFESEEKNEQLDVDYKFGHL